MSSYTVRQFGKKGRFANQLFQYAHLRQESPGEYQCPPWVGQYLFGLTDPPVTKGAQDLGYRFPLNADYYDKDLFRFLFRPAVRCGVVSDLQAKGRTVIGLHLRRGDYGTFRRRSARWCFVAPSAWYLDWLKENVGRFASPILYIASDEPDKVMPDFAEYDTVYPGPEYPDAPFWRDFYSLTQCDVLLISNSTFGFAASMLNERATEFWRPRLSLQKLVPYDPWHSEIVLRDESYR